MQAADLHRERRSDAGREGEGRDAMSSTKAGEKVEKASSARSHTERERGKAKMELHQDKALHREQAMEHMVNDGRLGRALFLSFATCSFTRPAQFRPALYSVC
jgi:hypothetical protein